MRSRYLAPDSEWLFFKVYCGRAFADELLTDVLEPTIERLRSQGRVDSWFFIRYSDPEFHLRLRLRGSPDALRGHAFPALAECTASFLEDGTVWRTQLDTYEREIERYGGHRSLELCESIFNADSRAAVHLIRELRGGSEAHRARWALLLRGMDEMMSDLGHDLGAKHAIVRRGAEGLGREFQADRALRKALQRKYRAERDFVKRLLEDAPPQPIHPKALSILRERSNRIAPFCLELQALSATGQLTQSLQSITWSLLHMQANRVCRSVPNAHELLVYRFLERTYDSRLARSGRKSLRRPESERSEWL